MIVSITRLHTHEAVGKPSANTGKVGIEKLLAPFAFSLKEA